MLGIFASHFPRADLASTLDAVAAHGLTAVQFDFEGGPPEPIRAALKSAG